MKTILCYGDSNTHGSLPMATIDDDDRLGPTARWSGVMASSLGDSFCVIEEGLPGRTTVHDDPFEGAHLNGLRILPAILNSHRPLDGLVIMLGTNDLKTRFAAPAADIAIGVEKMALMAATLAHPPRVLIVRATAGSRARLPDGILRRGGSERHGAGRGSAISGWACRGRVFRCQFSDLG